MPKIYNLLYIFIYTLNKNLKQNKNDVITAVLLLHLMSYPHYLICSLTVRVELSQLWPNAYTEKTSVELSRRP